MPTLVKCKSEKWKVKSEKLQYACLNYYDIFGYTLTVTKRQVEFISSFFMSHGYDKQFWCLCVKQFLLAWHSLSWTASFIRYAHLYI